MFHNCLEVSREKVAVSNKVELTGDSKGVESKMKLDPAMEPLHQSF